MGFRRWAFALAVGLSACSAAPEAPLAADDTPRPNIVFVLLDDLRFDAMGFLTPGLETPNIDYLAKNRERLLQQKLGANSP